MYDENLELLYENILNADSKGFFIELRIYSDYINSEIKFKKIKTKLQKEHKEDYRKLEERKNILLFSLLSIVIFSIISFVVNIKRLTEKPKS